MLADEWSVELCNFLSVSLTAEERAKKIDEWVQKKVKLLTKEGPLKVKNFLLEEKVFFMLLTVIENKKNAFLYDKKLQAQDQRI